MRDDSPVVSVVLPTFRRPHLVERAADSVLRQTFTDLELIVVDDGSGDGTDVVLDRLAARDRRVHVVRHETNRGLSAARNSGIEIARGRYIAFLDDDDEWLPAKLERQVAVLERSPEEVGVVTCFEEWRRDDGSVRSRDIRLDGDVLRRLQREDLVHMQTLLVRRECLDAVGPFDEALFHHEDMDMALRLAEHCSYKTVPERLHVFHVTAGSLSGNVDNRIAALRRIIDKNQGIRGSRRLRSLWTYRIGRYEAERGNAAQWRRELMDAIRWWPLNFRAWSMLIVGLLVGPDANVRLARLRGRLARSLRRIVS